MDRENDPDVSSIREGFRDYRDFIKTELGFLGSHVNYAFVIHAFLFGAYFQTNDPGNFPFRTPWGLHQFNLFAALGMSISVLGFIGWLGAVLALGHAKMRFHERFKKCGDFETYQELLDSPWYCQLLGKLSNLGLQVLLFCAWLLLSWQ